MLFCITVLFFFSSLFSWPWLGVKGSSGLTLNYTSYQSDTKFSDGTQLQTAKGDKIPIFVDGPGEVGYQTFELSGSYVIHKHLAVSLYTQWALVAWENDNPETEQGLGDTHLSLKIALPYSLPLVAFAGVQFPTGINKISSQSISLGDGVFSYSTGFSTGFKPLSWLILYSTQQLKLPTTKTTENSSLKKGLSWKGSLNSLLTFQSWGWGSSYEWLTSRDSKSIILGFTRPLPGVAYHTLSTSLFYKLKRVKIFNRIKFPLSGIEYATAFRYGLGFSLSFPPLHN